ncbi:hypothetical protein HPDFL43_01765 [Hoeflea phototrophica DFL-43]|jgi:hypothetical protein|uniref:Uncharacterized protein n=1 Tax=Hoeflea phototrophica (strain DSM 17068 / NCIMB 14078 / DFL-43) TaxID=411684 RepID=A9CZZ2_HOEPD|nr:hypothetical protein [Hoeflea phototrophica]EDQ34884.2 hypothetical protein HPDFL43_01765 [Hoeflea phototrophica DFL-43]
MRYSKPTTPTFGSNVIPFPKTPHTPIADTPGQPRRTGPTLNHSDNGPGSGFQQPTQTVTAQNTPNQVHRQRAILTMAFKRKPGSPEQADEVAAWTARQVLLRAGEGEAEKTWLPPLVRRNLDLMCACRHPVGLILRDWLDGNRRLLPANFQTLVEYSTCVAESE